MAGFFGEDAMTKPDMTVVEALERISSNWSENYREDAVAALPIASRQASAEAELAKYKEALEFFTSRCHLIYFYPDQCDTVLLDSPKIKDCPIIIRELIEKKGEL
jgi:hypothetical protein